MSHMMSTLILSLVYFTKHKLVAEGAILGRVVLLLEPGIFIAVDRCVFCVSVCVCQGAGRKWAQALESVRTSRGGGGGEGRVRGGQRDDEEEGEEVGSFP